MNFNNSFKEILKIILESFLPTTPQQKFLKNISAEKLLELSGEKKYPAFKNCLGSLNYHNKIVKDAVWSLKFRNNAKMAKIFAEIIYDNLLEELSELKISHNFDQPLLIPIPMSKNKKISRGYNQTELIAQELVKLDKNQSFEYRKNILKKTKDTLPQSRTSGQEERAKNLQGCFRVVMPKLIKHRNIILLDDVITTGTTMSEAEKEIRKHSPKKIIWVSFAH